MDRTLTGHVSTRVDELLPFAQFFNNNGTATAYERFCKRLIRQSREVTAYANL